MLVGVICEGFLEGGDQVAVGRWVRVGLRVGGFLAA